MLLYQILWIDQIFFSKILMGRILAFFYRRYVLLDCLRLINRVNLDVWTCSAYLVLEKLDI